jgi:hypothetical protein
MTTSQLFFAVAGLLIAGFGFLKYYIDAKIDPIAADVKRLIDYLVIHEGKIARLEERLK